MKKKLKSVAIVGLGNSCSEYIMSKIRSEQFDETWAINAISSVIYHDKVFMLDPASRFLDTPNAGNQTDIMSQRLKAKLNIPIFSCELDKRCPGLVEYPIDEILKATNCHYINNTVAYAIAFAVYNEVAVLKLFGIDFSYQGNLHFAESGRACVEFWLSKCISEGMQVQVAGTSGLLDTNVPAEQKLYGYHRLADPLVVLEDEKGLLTKKVSEMTVNKVEQQPILIGREDNHLKSPEPKKW